MRTLLENITMVKGVEYFVVIAFCFGFIALWVLVHTDRGTKKKIVATVIPLALIFAGGAIVLNKYFSSDLIAEATAQENGSAEANNPQLNIDSDYFAINYGPATEFHKIMSDKVSCNTCHHNSKEIQPCKNCHDKPFNLSNADKPGLKAAYHQRCIGCHNNKFDGPDSCKHCHTGKTLQISTPTLHSLTWENCSKCHSDSKDSKIVYHDNCLTCHTKSATGAVKLPDNHTGRTVDTCKGCHTPKGG